MSQMLKSSGAMATATLTSRILGLFREMVYAAFMGNTWVASAFIMAFTVPNLFRRLLGEGALTAAFIPIFKQKEVQEGETEMWRAANAVLSGLITATGALTALVVAGISISLLLGIPDPQTRLMLKLLRLMFPYMVLVCLAAVLIGMANARGHFFVPALGSVILNLIMIASVLFLAPRMGKALEQQILGLAIGVVVAGFAQAFFQVPSLTHEGFRFHWVSPWREPIVHEVVRKMLPGSIGVAAFQINVLVTQCFAFWLEPSVVATFNYAVRLMELPQGIFGISLATFLLPALSGLAAEKKYPEFRQLLKEGLGSLAFANLIAAAIAFGLAEPIVRLLFERGKFDVVTTHRVSIALMCLAPGLLMFSMNNILARAFFALKDTTTPMKISVFCLMLNLLLSVALVQSYREAGLGVANTITACFNTGLLFYALKKKLARLDMAALRETIVALSCNALLAGFVAWGLSRLWAAKLGHSSLGLKIGQVFVPAMMAGALYWGIALWVRVPAAKEILALISARLRKTKS
jgi:putative peptidoglycan lipid II flippase